MKRCIAMMLVFAICLSLCACGKSEAVKNVESLIEAIGGVTVDSKAAVVAAEEAYNALTEAEKEKVENYAVLTDARDTLDAALVAARHEALEASFAGEWVSELKGDQSIYLNTDGTLTQGDLDGTWKLNEEETALELSLSGLNFVAKIVEEDGFQKLELQNGYWGVKAENYQAAFDKKFVAVELNGENAKDYLGGPVQAGYSLDAWGEEVKKYPVYLLTSKVYEDGLVYIGCSDDFAVELIYEDVNGTRTETHSGCPFDSFSGIESELEPGYWYYDRPVSIGEKAKGTLYYVRAEYVAENYMDTNGQTNVKLTNGSVYYTGSYGSDISFSYEDYMR